MFEQNKNHAAKIENSICLVLIVVIVMAITTETAIACQPCRSRLTLEQSLKKADLVIVGKRIDYDPDEKMPSSIKVNITKVLKGAVNKKQIEVKSWYGICPYGIVVDAQTYVMILRKLPEMPAIFTTVDMGCSVTKLLVKSGKVSVDGRIMSIEDIARIINKSS